MKEYIVYNADDNFYNLEDLVRYNKEPTAFNSFVRIKKNYLRGENAAIRSHHWT